MPFRFRQWRDEIPQERLSFILAKEMPMWCRSGSDAVPLGAPIANTAVLIAQQREEGNISLPLQLQKMGEEGEIVLVGSGLAAGYFG